MGFALPGLLLSRFFVHESHGHGRHEAAMRASALERAPAPGQKTQPPDQQAAAPSFKDIFLFTSWKNRTLFAVCQAGLGNNLNDGLAWRLFPLFFAARSLSLAQSGPPAGT